MRFARTHRCRWVAPTILLACSATFLGAQESASPIEIHASLNAAYGRSHTLPILGVPTTGTSDYRVVTLQGRYRLGENDQFVAQIFNRRLGTSPLASAIPDVTMQWAYYQHRAGDWTVKLGRNPLPRGLFNEVRYIGTVLPFFRPPMELQQDAFDAIDGAVITYRKELPGGLELEQHAFGGGSENRSFVTTSAGMQLRLARTENMFGGQTYVSLPFASSRLGFYGARYNFEQPTQHGYRTNTVFSAEATPLSRLKLETEHGRFTGHGPMNDSKQGYVQGTVRATDRLSVSGQWAYIDRRLFFTNSALNQWIPEVRTKAAATTFALTRTTRLKFEHHWREGWAFDAATPPVASQTATSVTLSPKRKGTYYLLSVASSF